MVYASEHRDGNARSAEYARRNGDPLWSEKLFSASNAWWASYRVQGLTKILGLVLSVLVADGRESPLALLRNRIREDSANRR